MDVAEAYSVLELPPGTLSEALHAAWKTLILKHHPDRYQQFGDVELKKAQARTKRINRAYSTLRTHLSETTIDTIQPGVGIAPDSASFLRKAAQSVAQTQAAIEQWNRYLNRSRVGLTDGQRLTADTYANQKEYLVLRAALQALVEKRDTSISVLLETNVLRAARQTLESRRTDARLNEVPAFGIDTFLPTEPERLMPLLAEIQSIGEHTLQSVESLHRRFEQLEVERLGLGERTKAQGRTLRHSLKPFIDAARQGREKYDAAEVCVRQCGAILRIEQTQKVETKTVLKSRLHQLNELSKTLEALQFRQIEGDAAETVYDQLLNRQSHTQSLSRNTFKETEKVSEQLKDLFVAIRLKHREYPQSVLSELHAELEQILQL